MGIARFTRSGVCLIHRARQRDGTTRLQKKRHGHGLDALEDNSIDARRSWELEWRGAYKALAPFINPARHLLFSSSLVLPQPFQISHPLQPEQSPRLIHPGDTRPSQRLPATLGHSRHDSGRGKGAIGSTDRSSCPISPDLGCYCARLAAATALGWRH